MLIAQRCGLFHLTFPYIVLLEYNSQPWLKYSFLLQIIFNLRTHFDVTYGSFEYVDKTKVMIIEKDSMTERVIEMNIKKVGQMKECAYLGCLFTRDGKSEDDIERLVKEEMQWTEV